MRPRHMFLNGEQPFWLSSVSSLVSCAEPAARTLRPPTLQRSARLRPGYRKTAILAHQCYLLLSHESRKLHTSCSSLTRGAKLTPSACAESRRRRGDRRLPGSPQTTAALTGVVLPSPSARRLVGAWEAPKFRALRRSPRRGRQTFDLQDQLHADRSFPC